MTGITAGGVEIDRDFAAPPKEVFDGWTKAQHFARWFGGKDVHVPLDSLDFVAEPGRTWTAQMALPSGNTMDWTGTSSRSSLMSVSFSPSPIGRLSPPEPRSSSN
jgi:uncharacterized protein YndB with AHSA1/START domain